MYYSMIDNSGNFVIYAFCMDDEGYLRMQALCLESVILVKYTELEESDNELYCIKNTRSKIEYYFTCTPAICRYVFKKNSNIDLLTYLDADLFFYSSPEVIFEEIGDKSIAIVEHRFSRFGRKFIKLGIFNVAWISFRRDEQGMNCLNEYRQQCLEWCYDYLDGDKYADQKYLDNWPDKYSNHIIIRNKGVNLAGWNIGNYTITKRGGSIFVDDDQLVFYHFAGLKQRSNNYYTSSISSYYVFIDKIVKNNLYKDYIKRLKSFSSDTDVTKKTINPKYQNFSIWRIIKYFLRDCRIIIFGDLIKV